MTATTTDRHRDARRGRAFEVMAVLLLGVATLGSAWCGYQAARWNGREGELARQATDELVEASRLFGLATQTISYDSMIVAEYAQAKAAGDERLLAFYRRVLVRPEFEAKMAEWEAEVEAGGTPENLLADEGYREDLLARYTAAAAEAEASSDESAEAGENADEFILMTVLFASALFFAGVTTSFRLRPAQAVLVLSAGAIIAYSAMRLSDLPVA